MLAYLLFHSALRMNVPYTHSMCRSACSVRAGLTVDGRLDTICTLCVRVDVVEVTGLGEGGD